MAKKKIRNEKFDEVVDVTDFHATFNKKYPKKQLGGKHKTIVPLPLSLYKKITKEYFDIYMKELYFQKNNSYFLFGGMLMLCHTAETVHYVRKNGGAYNHKRKSLTLFWYNRPSGIYQNFLKLLKLNGTTNVMYRIENLFRANFDIELLPKFDQVKKEFYREKKLHEKP